MGRFERVAADRKTELRIARTDKMIAKKWQWVGSLRFAAAILEMNSAGNGFVCRAVLNGEFQIALLAFGKRMIRHQGKDCQKGKWDQRMCLSTTIPGIEF